MMSRIPITFDITTPRLTLEPLQRSHINEFSLLIERNREDLINYFPMLTNQVQNQAEARKWIAERRQLHAGGSAISMSIKLSNLNRMVGYLGIMSIDMRVPRCELAYFIDKRFRGNGYMEEALHGALHWLIRETGMRKFLGRVAPQNTSSLHLLEKIGFVREGLIRADFRSGHGIVGDCLYMGLLSEEYLRAK
jgi:ribosomal-protein-serine acetyltransferase